VYVCIDVLLITVLLYGSILIKRVLLLHTILNTHVHYTTTCSITVREGTKVLGVISASTLLERIRIMLHLAKAPEPQLHRLVSDDTKVRLERIQDNIATTVWELDFSNSDTLQRTWANTTVESSQLDEEPVYEPEPEDSSYTAGTTDAADSPSIPVAATPRV
jgi:hypothetical protein